MIWGNYAERGGCYNTLRVLHNSPYHTKANPIISLLFIQNIKTNIFQPCFWRQTSR